MKVIEFLDSIGDHVNGDVKPELVLEWLKKTAGDRPLANCTWRCFYEPDISYEYCLCHHKITYNFVAVCEETNLGVVLGSECIKKAMSLCDIVFPCTLCTEPLKDAVRRCVHKDGLCPACEKESNTLLQFGKFRDETYGWMYENEKEYCTWFLKQWPAGKHGKNFHNYLRKRRGYKPVCMIEELED